MIKGTGGTAPNDIRVVVVDDHEMLVESLVRMLRDAVGIEVVGSANTATAGLDLVRLHRPDIVIMDYHLPDMDGAQATRMVRGQFPDCKVITLTGSERTGAYFAALEAGSAAWVRKTRATRDLVAAVHAVHQGRTVPNDELTDLPPLDELAVHYQPVVTLATRQPVGVEALVRWPHSTRGVVYPDEFLPLAEETGYIHVLGETVRDIAVRQLADWQQRNVVPADFWMSLNVSGTRLMRDDFADCVADLLERTQVSPRSVVLEVTETVLLDDDVNSLARLTALKGLGVQLALDDFGTAFSSLSYLRRFPFDHLKIDSAFTAELPGSARACQLIESVQQLAEGLGIHAIAEGVERPNQVSALLNAGWSLGQGYLFAKPAPAHQVEPLLGSA